MSPSSKLNKLEHPCHVHNLYSIVVNLSDLFICHQKDINVLQLNARSPMVALFCVHNQIDADIFPLAKHSRHEGASWLPHFQKTDRQESDAVVLFAGMQSYDDVQDVGQHFLDMSRSECRNHWHAFVDNFYPGGVGWIAAWSRGNVEEASLVAPDFSKISLKDFSSLVDTDPTNDALKPRASPRKQSSRKRKLNAGPGQSQ